MSYTIFNANGTPVVVVDNVINQDYYNTSTQVGIQLVGRNAIDYGAPIAQNFLQMVENFASPTLPVWANGTGTPQGMLWFNTTNSSLYVKFQAPAGADSLANWAQIIVAPPAGSTTPITIPGNVIITGSTTFNGPITGIDATFSGTVTADTIFANTIGSLSNPVDNIYGGIFHGIATQAEYADLAERYEADRILSPGTLVSLGGAKEITTTTSRGDVNVFGVISKNPGLMLNAAAGDNDSHPYVALTGRVPVIVVGKVKKGDRLISSHVAGAAESIEAKDLDLFSPYQIIGRALENKTTHGIGQILAVVGVK